MVQEQFQIKDKFFDLISKNMSRDGFVKFLKESCGELDNIDFKTDWIEKDKLAKIILAMANSGGGAIIIGIKETEEKKYEPCGIIEIRDAADVDKDLEKYIPRNLSYTILNFVYNDSLYGEFCGKQFQTIIISDTPEKLPFFALAESKNINKDIVYVRKGTSCVKATSSDLERIIQRRLENIFKESSDLKLEEHLVQLRLLYDSIPRKKRRLVKQGTYSLAALTGLKALVEGMAGMFGDPDIYEEIDNEIYPAEDYEQFLVRMIEKKKLKIEKVLDLK
ncbi:MAG: putative DNA binding domain-containing protein [Lachnospiraceae bacterium]|nr:putative DNA binding domain-containing protein [Lachnospiraceae bacterium]